jgi:hypothetical protein
MNYSNLSTDIPPKVLISQALLTPESVSAKSYELQRAGDWAVQVCIFIFSLMMLASLINFFIRRNS